MKYLNTKTENLYLIALQSTKNTFISIGENIGTCIRENLKNGGIESIKIFNSSKGCFVRVNKKDLTHFLSYHTDTTEELRKVNFLK